MFLSQGNDILSFYFSFCPRYSCKLHAQHAPLLIYIRLIQQGRQAKGLSQKDLATKINEKQQIVTDYEAGRYN